jgi:hypothetical protein
MKTFAYWLPRVVNEELCMKISGFASNTGEIFISAKVISGKHKIYSTISFLIDTGASTSTISFKDAKILGIDLEKLRRSSPALGIGGILESYILDDVDLVIVGAEPETLYSRHFNKIPVFGKSNMPEPECYLFPSILGLDFLGKAYSVQIDSK